MSDIQLSMGSRSNGASKHQSAGSGQQPHAATVSFHNIYYKVTQGGNCLCRKKATTKDILVDLNLINVDVYSANFGDACKKNQTTILTKSTWKDYDPPTPDAFARPQTNRCHVLVDEARHHQILLVRQRGGARSRASGSDHQRKLAFLNFIQVGRHLLRFTSALRQSSLVCVIIDPSESKLKVESVRAQTSSQSFIQRFFLLWLMGNHGRTIILSIHQPRYSIYRLFDSLTLLVTGKQVFHGPAQSALDYFSDIGYTCEPHNNPADFFLDVINGDSTAVAGNDADKDPDSVSKSRRGIEDKLVEEYRSCHFYKQTKAELERIVQAKPTSGTTTRSGRTITYNTGFLTQFKWVSKRTFRNLMLNPQTGVAQVAVTLFLALVVGAIFYDVQDNQSGMQNRFGALFFVTVNQCFSSLSAAELFISERKLFIHEYISGYYRLSVYFLCKVLSDIITLRTIPALVFSCVAYFLIGLKPTVEAFFLFMFTVMLVAYTATSMALAISADQTVVAIANIFMTIACVFMMIFAGLLVNLTSIASWLAWLKYFSIPRYGLSALQANEFTGLYFCHGLNDSIIPPGLACTGEEFLTEQGVDYSPWGFWQNHVALGVMTICFLTITYLKLRFIRKFS
ncbi:putative ATP-binding cassette sub-family G member 2-like [Scophthalmus maximus]|uniref:Putative ATP-binding cassette sub-family G member 2-like n=1 Tax=Scophthalmus maximus TaxID=52904 RepID=A0A2U9B0D3_SCOMX|nr:putative ATP-binding cassette sub-family G member 2-like [Scophthalmus maximus]